MDFFPKDESFKNKNVLITGSTGGIGSILVEEMIKSQANVLAIAKNENKLLQKFSPYLKSKQLKYEIINFENPSTINEGFKNAILKFEGKLDILIICHGSFQIGRIAETGVDGFDSAINVNTRSVFHILSLSIPFLKLSRGNVVAISSVEANVLSKDGFMNSISKSMLDSLIKCAALELAAFGIRVNGVAPGITATRHRVNDVFGDPENKDYLERMGGAFLLNQKVLDPKDIVNAIMFLASEDASFITGEIIVVDNGFSLNHDLSFNQTVV